MSEKMIQVTASDLCQIRNALSTAMSARCAVDMYDVKRMALVKIEKLLHGDDAPPPPVDYADKYGLHGMMGVEVARLAIGCLSSYDEMGAVLDAWRNANTPPAPEPDMFWLQGAEETPAVGMPLRIAEEIQADLGIGVGIVECAVRLPDRKMRVWTEENEDGDEVTKWEWVSE